MRAADPEERVCGFSVGHRRMRQARERVISIVATAARFFYRLAARSAMRALAALLLAGLLAGCAQDAPAPVVAGEPVYSDAEVPMGAPLAPLRWHTLSEADFTTAAMQPFATDVTVPNGTIAVYVNMTMDAGAIYGLGVQLGECLWQRDLAFVGEGQTIVADCGGILEGSAHLQLTTSAGAITGRVAVVGLLCDPLAGRCPGRLPVP
jgi:hypothetical protein